MPERWFFVNIGFACFGLCLDEETKTCRFAPPVVGWMNGKKTEQIRAYLKQHKAKIIELTKDCKVYPFEDFIK